MVSRTKGIAIWLRVAIVGTAMLHIGAMAGAQTARDSLIVQIGLEMEAAFGAGDVSYFASVFDDSAFLANFVDFDHANENIRLINEELANTHFGEQFGNGIIDDLNTGSYFTFIRFSEDSSGGYYLRFRHFGEDGLNYSEYFLTFEEDGSFGISDIYNYITGEYITQTMERMYKPLIEEFSRDQPPDLAYSRGVARLADLERLMDAGELDSARIVFATQIPAEIRESAFGQLIAMQLLDPSDESAYAAVLDNLLQFTKARAAAHLVSIDVFLLAGEYDRSLAAVDSLEWYVEDPWLDYLRGNISWERGDLATACRYYEQVRSEYPYFVEAYDALLTLYPEIQQTDLAVALLDTVLAYTSLTPAELDTICRLDFPAVAAHPDYPGWYERARAEEAAFIAEVHNMLSTRWKSTGIYNEAGQRLDSFPALVLDADLTADLILVADGSCEWVRAAESRKSGRWTLDPNRAAIDWEVPVAVDDPDYQRLVDTGQAMIGADGRAYRLRTHYLVDLTEDALVLYQEPDRYLTYERVK
ncbi:MAG: hypothetical protein R3301_14745 [Saprospiraceae bacterium]|nr:hypothetical protein [Saprospiraceae bacterium]